MAFTSCRRANHACSLPAASTNPASGHEWPAGAPPCADADGYALVRLLDADGRVRHVRMLTIQRRARPQALRELVHRTGNPGGVTWELWTGRYWLHFTNAPSIAATDE